MNIYNRLAIIAVFLPFSVAACSQEDTDATPPQEQAENRPQISEDPANASDAAPDPAPSGETTDEQRADAGGVQTRVPARFQGTYGETRSSCQQRSHGNFTVKDTRIDFFESRGEVSRVRVDGDYAALTVREEYADAVNDYIFYMALDGADGLRFRYDKNERQRWVRCRS